jgi:hypothetical protein
MTGFQKKPVEKEVPNAGNLIYSHLQGEEGFSLQGRVCKIVEQP